MPVTNADNPTIDKPKTAAKPATKAADTTDSPAQVQYARASESSDAAVHQLLAVRQIALSNEDADAVAAADRDLAELGFAV